MELRLLETKIDCGATVCVWQNEAGQTFTVNQYETAVSDYEDFSSLYGRRAEFKSLSASQLEAFYTALEVIEQADPNNARGYKAQ